MTSLKACLRTSAPRYSPIASIALGSPNLAPCEHQSPPFRWITGRKGKRTACANCRPSCCRSTLPPIPLILLILSTLCANVFRLHPPCFRLLPIRSIRGFKPFGHRASLWFMARHTPAFLPSPCFLLSGYESINIDTFLTLSNSPNLLSPTSFC